MSITSDSNNFESQIPQNPSISFATKLHTTTYQPKSPYFTKDNENKLIRKLALEITQKEQDLDLDSLKEIGQNKNIFHNIFQNDQLPLASSVTNITNDTDNKFYYSDDASIDSKVSSMVSDMPIQSMKESNIDNMFKEGLTIDEIQNNHHKTAAHTKYKASERVSKLMALSLQVS